MNIKSEKWLLWVDEARHPAVNMAIDEELLLYTGASKIPIVRFYSWDRPSISIGYVQNYEAAAREKYYVVRRLTGGGIVFHDVDLTYTISIPSEHKICRLNREGSYYIFHKLIIEALKNIGIESELAKTSEMPKNRSVMQCFPAPAKFDVVLKNDNSGLAPKIAGAAQRRTKAGILHQGSIVIPEIDKRRESLINAIIGVFKNELHVEFVTFSPDPALIEKALSLACSKYDTDGWNKLR